LLGDRENSHILQLSVFVSSYVSGIKSIPSSLSKSKYPHVARACGNLLLLKRIYLSLTDKVAAVSEAKPNATTHSTEFRYAETKPATANAVEITELQIMFAFFILQTFLLHLFWDQFYLTVLQMNL
jgi:hypothetical protein